MTEKNPEVSTLAVISLVMGILTFVILLFPLGAIPAIICGHMALSKIKRPDNNFTGKGLAVAGLVLGYIGLFVTLLLMIFNFILFARVSETMRGKIAIEAEKFGEEENIKPQQINSTD